MDKEILKEELVSLIEKRLQSTGYVFYVEYIFMGKRRYTQLYYSQGRSVDRATIADDLKKIYPEAQLISFKKADFVPGSPLVVMREGAAWTKKSGQNSEGGLNEKGRKSYERENPGSDLKAPSKKVGNPRRASFCARMKGMRKRQKPENNTGDDRLSKSLRAWNC